MISLCIGYQLINSVTAPQHARTSIVLKHLPFQDVIHDMTLLHGLAKTCSFLH